MERLAVAQIRTLAILLLFCMKCPFAQAKNLFFGIKGISISASDMQHVTGGCSKSKSYSFGPALEVKLPVEKMSLEASLLYHR